MRQKWQKTLFIIGDGKAELGFSLIEVLLSIAITILLTNLIIQLCMTLVRQQAFLQEKITLAENARFAEFILRREIQPAGFCGCNRLNQLSTHYHVARWYLPMVPVRVFAKDTQIMGKKIHPESEVIVIEKMVKKTDAVVTQEKPKSIKTDLANRFELGELLIIADCTQADIFAPSTVWHGVTSQMITAAKPLNEHYCHADLGKLAVTAFFIEKTSRKNHQGQSVKALYSYDFVSHRKTEWITGIEAMEFFYATCDGNDNHIIFKSFSHTTDLSKLRLIKIVLTFSSSENYDIRMNPIAVKKQEIWINLREFS